MQNETRFKNRENILKKKKKRLSWGFGFVIMISPDYRSLLDKKEGDFCLQTADSVAL